MGRHGFQQLKDILTSITETTTSLISLIFVSDTDNIQCHGNLPRIADHEGVFVNFHCSRQKSKIATRKIYDYKNIDETGLIDFIRNYDFQSTVFSLPVTEQAVAFTSVLTDKGLRGVELGLCTSLLVLSMTPR